MINGKKSLTVFISVLNISISFTNRVVMWLFRFARFSNGEYIFCKLITVASLTQSWP